MAVQYFEGIGRRKESTARVRLMTGTGQFSVNGKLLGEFFTRTGDKELILGAFHAASENQTQYDVTVVVNGGGVTGQTGAVKLGLARALIKMNPDLQPLLKKGRFLTRDSREKERKKPGLKRARKAPTYTKR
jgi:small subunit ribosomal protein S9